MTATDKDTASGEDVTKEYKVTYKGPLLVPSTTPVPPGTVYELDIPSLEISYDPSISFFLMSFYGYTKDNETILSEGDRLMMMIPYTGNDPVADLPGTYTHLLNNQPINPETKSFIAGYYYDLGMGYTIPMPSYFARYSETMQTIYCNLICG